jgi:hypothetical protein
MLEWHSGVHLISGVVRQTRERHGDENEVDRDIIKQLQRRYPPSLVGAVMRICGLAWLEAKVEIEMNAVLA